MDHLQIRVAILNRNRLFRESLAVVLLQQKTIIVMSSVAGFDQVDGELVSLQPDLFILDFGAPGRGGIEDARRIRAVSPNSKILMINVPDTEADVLACIETGGASGYLSQDASVENLLSNVRAIVAGEALCSPRIAGLAFSRISALACQDKGSHPGHMAQLTRREVEIVALIEDGLSNKQIADRLNIEVQTVKNHVHNILDKLQVDDRRQVSRSARERGLVTKPAVNS